MAPTSIKNNMRRLRFDANEMTQQTLAEHVGVTRQTIIAIEAAKYSPSLELAFKIADVFSVPFEKVSSTSLNMAPGAQNQQQPT